MVVYRKIYRPFYNHNNNDSIFKPAVSRQRENVRLVLGNMESILFKPVNLL